MSDYDIYFNENTKFSGFGDSFTVVFEGCLQRTHYFGDHKLSKPDR